MHRMSKQKEPATPHGANLQEEVDWNQINPYDVMKMQNCKSFKFSRGETYPNIKPPISKCDPEETAAILAASMDVNGCGYFDPRLLKKPVRNYSLSDGNLQNKSNKLETRSPCGNRQKQETFYKSGDNPQMVLDWSQITPYDLMRMENAKMFDFQKCEKYPSVKLPKSSCNSEWTAEWLADATKDYGSERLFDMENDDILEIWKTSPNKESLGFYGIGSGIQGPEAVEFNQLVSKCLEEASSRGKKKPQEEPTPAPHTPVKRTSKSPKAMLLNRSMLESKLIQMPTVKQKLHPSTALNWIHCPHRAASEPLAEEKPTRQSKVKQPGFLGNTRAQKEWRKYKDDPVAYKETFMRDMKQFAMEIENEPKNYEELYTQLVACFERDVEKNPIFKTYYKCCKRSGKQAAGGKGGKGRRGAQGDSEDEDEVGVDGDFVRRTIGSEIAEGEAAEYGPDEEQLIKFGSVGYGKTAYADGAGDKIRAPITDTIPAGDGKNKITNDTKPVIDQKDQGSKKDKDKGKAKGKDEAKTTKATDQSKKADATADNKTGKIAIRLADELASVVDKGAPLTKNKSYANIFQPADGGVRPSNDRGSFTSDIWKRPKDDAMFKKPRRRRGQQGEGLLGNRTTIGKNGKTKDDIQSKAPILKECPCEICDFMNRRASEVDPPFILEMLKEQKNREIEEYRKRLCHRAYSLCRNPRYPAPQHKCDPVDCEDSFYLNPKIAVYFDRLTALKKLQKLLCENHQQCDHQLLFKLQDLTDRLFWRLSHLL